MHRYITLLTGFTLLSFSSNSQSFSGRCGSVENFSRQLSSNPSLAAQYKAAEEAAVNYQGSVSRRSASVITIPVVVHIVYNTAIQNISDEQVLSQIEVLNEDFRRMNADSINTPGAFRDRASDTQIEFVLAHTDPQGNYTGGITRTLTSASSFSANDNVKFSATGGVDAWPSDSYLNIWVCNMPTMLGYAQFPGGDPSTDGIVVTYNAFGRKGNLRGTFDRGRTATHEIGHWLGLKHVWGDAACGDDNISDTPAQQNANAGCPSFPHLSCSGGPDGDMFMNYMDYSDDACMNMFTADQGGRMRAVLNTSRTGILTSPGKLVPANYCSGASGLRVSSVSSVSAHLEWTASSSQNYIFYHKKGAQEWDSLQASATAADLTGLQPGTEYECKVKSYCSGNISVFSLTGTFTTSMVNSVSETGYSTRELVVYPSPATDAIKILSPLEVPQKLTLRIINSLGQEVMNVKSFSGTEDISLDVSSINNGVYFCRMETSGHTWLSRFIIAR